MKSAQLQHPLIGRTIRAVRLLEQGALEGLYDESRVTALELDDGTLLVGSQDHQLDAFGWLFEILPGDDGPQSWRLVQAIQPQS